MKRVLPWLPLSLFVCTLAVGCGGGGGSSEAAGATTPSQDVVDRYVGAFRSACVSDGSISSTIQTLAIVKKTAAAADFTLSGPGYAGTQCAGSPLVTVSLSGNMVCAGTKTLGAEIFDKCVFTYTSLPTPLIERQIVTLRNGTTLVSGNSDGPLDAEGYPTTLDAMTLTKQ